MKITLKVKRIRLITLLLASLLTARAQAQKMFSLDSDSTTLVWKLQPRKYKLVVEPYNNKSKTNLTL